MDDPYLKDAIIDIAQGNVGAVSILLAIFKAGRPDILIYLYEEGPKGADLWILFKDDNGEDLERLMGDIELRMMTHGS